MSIQSEIDRINENVASTYSVLEEAGADMPAEQNTDNLSATAASIKAVLYKEQTLTEEQKAQARKNIGIETVPDYVVTEAMSVLDKLIAAQGSRTFVLGAITDMHYGSSDYTDGVIHACQGMHHIAKRIKLDAVAVLGDYTDEHQMDTETAVTDLEEMNALLDCLCNTVNLRVKGNHDHRPGASAQTYRYIFAHNDDVVWGSRIGGYFYRDFPAYKLRIVCLNTTEVARDNVSVSDEQYNFFVNALDMSAKDDAEEWGILILSHHPLDWTVTSGAYRFGPILNAYQTGSSWSDGTISCNFADNNSAILVGNIHGHIHNLLTDKIYVGEPGNSEQTSVWRMAVPASRVDFVNHYSGIWIEDTTYSKTQNTAEDTAFNIICIDLDGKTIKAFCYGAGYDRELTYYEAPGEEPAYTNQIPISTDTDGTVYNGKGYANDMRIGSDGVPKSGTGYSCTGFIPFTSGSVIRSSEGMFDAADSTGYLRIAMYDSSKARIGEFKITPDTLNSYSSRMTITNGALWVDFDIEAMISSDHADRTAFIRFSASNINDDSVITIDQEIV